MIDLSTSVRYIKGIGEKKAQALGKLGVFSLYELLSYFPARYEDRTRFCPIAAAPEGEGVCIRALVADTPRLVRVRRGMELVKFRAVDESGSVDITYFNQNYVKDYLARGDSVCFFGKIEYNGSRRSMVNPAYEKEDKPRGVTGCILPVYRINAALNQRTLRDAVRQGLDACAAELPEILPEEIRARNGLAQARYAYENVHFPPDFDSLAIARRRLVFEELFLLACALGTLRAERTRESGLKLKKRGFSQFYKALPFTPTGAQTRAIDEAAADMTGGFVMNRLVQGDVGSGKTLVAAALCWLCRENGFVSAFMAPTEILAEQHLQTIMGFLKDMDIRVALLTGIVKGKRREEVLEGLLDGTIQILVGTHAVIEDTVQFARLGFVVVDEQHRFGVAQRAKLWSKSANPPHVLVMTATPIPRTLAMTLYGDLDVSVIDELPPGRKPVRTTHVFDTRMTSLYDGIRQQINEGRQVYIVFPLIEESEKSDLKNLEDGFEVLKEAFPEFRLSKVHGRMKPKDKEEEMQRFVKGETQILVATTVIEVGVNVPNASVMVILEAQRFGLAQLHQLRGRVGRGADQSFCILVTPYKLSEETRKRIDIMCDTNDGFRIAEADLKLRGPGDLEGTQQSGMAFDLKIADIARDGQIVQLARDEAQKIIDDDPECKSEKYALLWFRLRQLRKTNINWAAIS